MSLSTTATRHQHAMPVRTPQRQHDGPWLARTRGWNASHGSPGACCRLKRGDRLNSSMRAPIGSPYEPLQCAHLCASDSRCAYFSHLRVWGDCLTCSSCTNRKREISSTMDGMGEMYTSWQMRLLRRPPESSSHSLRFKTPLSGARLVCTNRDVYK